MHELSATLRQFFESLDSMGIAKIFSSLGFTAISLASARWFVDRQRWSRFKADVHHWLDILIETEKRHPNELRDPEWKSECERMLANAHFRPTEVVQLLDLAVIVAKAIAADKVFM